MLPTKFRFIWPNGFRGEEFKKSANQKEESPVAVMFVDGSGRNEQSLYRGPAIDAPCQVSVHLAEGFQRRRLKCEKLTDDRRQRPSDGKSSLCSLCLWQGELKKLNICILKKLVTFFIFNVKPTLQEFPCYQKKMSKRKYWNYDLQETDVVIYVSLLLHICCIDELKIDVKSYDVKYIHVCPLCYVNNILFIKKKDDYSRWIQNRTRSENKWKHFYKFISLSKHVTWGTDFELISPQTLVTYWSHKYPMPKVSSWRWNGYMHFKYILKHYNAANSNKIEFPFLHEILLKVKLRIIIEDKMSLQLII